MENNLLKPTKIHTLGDYYKTPYLREDCHRIKQGNAVTANDCAVRLSEKLPKDCVIVPIPSRSGCNEAFARMLAYYANVPIYYDLARELRPSSLYDMKKRGEQVTEKDTGLFLHGNPSDGRIVLVDNVIATGTTISAAIRAIGKPCEAACIAVDYEQYNYYHNE